MNKEKIVSIGAIVLVLAGIVGLAWYGGGKLKKQEVAAKPAAVALVNGVEITKEAFDTQLASAITAFKAQGINTDDPNNLSQIKIQALNDLINNELVNQGITKAGLSVGTQDVEAQVQALIAQAGGADKFKEQLTASNLTEEKLRENIGRQLLVQSFLLQNIDISTATATAAEIKKFYDDAVAAQKAQASTAEIPAFKDVLEQIRQQIINTKQQTLINAFIENLRSKSQISTTTVAL